MLQYGEKEVYLRTYTPTTTTRYSNVQNQRHLNQLRITEHDVALASFDIISQFDVIGSPSASTRLVNSRSELLRKLLAVRHICQVVCVRESLALLEANPSLLIEAWTTLSLQMSWAQWELCCGLSR